MKIFLILFGAILFIIVGPLISIAALNTLFSLSIPFNLMTWAGMVWVHAILAQGMPFKNLDNQ